MNENRRESSVERWERRYSELEAFVRVHGCVRITRNDLAHPKLRRWLKTQVALAVAGTLKVERWWRLRELGFELLGRNERWERRFAQLIEYRQRFGHCRVPARWKENIPFGLWVHNQRAFKKDGKLSAMRIALLESIGFQWCERAEVWGSRGERPSMEAHWQRMCAALEGYRQQHGHTEVPPTFREVRGLANWVVTQRMAKKQGVLRLDRRERLEAMGFAWQGMRRADSERWERRFAQLLEFRERFGHCHVPNQWNEDIAFGHWVHAQRAFKSRGNLSSERIQRLEAIGFAWHGPNNRSYLSDDRWARMFAHLVEYQKQHGDTQVPSSYRACNGLGGWVSNQRAAWWKGTLSEDCRARLDAIGFAWRGDYKFHSERWERRFEQLVAYRQQHGNCRVPAKWREDIALGRWVHNQRAFKKAGKLSLERIRRLEEIDFAWHG